eukprot:CAMPEP_0197177042 /NCGR_PEP_ID=MMETSP1423-20130617/2784_1 /TAXON_ID=476441 /ORGANISM="Pseudo-nitzschia heimii, Strain UNC1101" /LENGTH=189 /DNA_ID=CAMNT_0042626523 /DNA_START=114 /DNA_END=683 /DNA_ORIENTATION=-
MASLGNSNPGPEAQQSWSSSGPVTNVDLSDKLDKTSSYAKNENSAFPWTNLLIGDTRLGCKSDADEQIIFHFEFSEFVKIHSIKLTEFNNGIEPEQNPSRVLMFVNRVNLGFEDIEDVDPTTALDITNEDLKENADNLVLQFVKYQRVKSVTLFVEDNNGGEITALGGLKFFGKPVAGTNMNDFKSNQG